MHEDANAAAAVLDDACRERIEDVAALLVVGGVDVEKERLATLAPYGARDLLDVRHAGATVEVHAADVQTAPRQLSRRRLTESARSAENQRPAPVTLLRHRGRDIWQLS